jgi:hypothetical protein
MSSDRDTSAGDGQGVVPCRFVGGPYDGRTMNVAGHVDIFEGATMQVEPGYRWSPELGGWVHAGPEPERVDVPPATAHRVRYQRCAADRFELIETGDWHVE